MDFRVSGKLRTKAAEQASFTGVRVDALFHWEPAPGAEEPVPGPVTGRAVISTRSVSSVPHRISALSDDAGDFTFVFPDQPGLVGPVRFVVYSPAGEIVREVDVTAGELGDHVDIEVGGFRRPTATGEPVAENTTQRVAVDAFFRNDAAVRDAITANLRTRRSETDAVAARVEAGWKFSPSRFSADELARRRYVAPGSDPGEVVAAVVLSRVEDLRAAATDHSITLRNSGSLKSLLGEIDPAVLPSGTVELGPLIDFIQSRSGGSSLHAERTYTQCKAELEADRILDFIENGKQRSNGSSGTSPERTTAENRVADQLVSDTVNVQMATATSPESQLSYGKIPNSADDDRVQSGLLQTFQLRPGASDVTSYHDFHTLQIAFEHVWSEIFDGQLATVGRELYREYVKLKDFSGSGEPDLQVGTLADLTRLMEEVKRLSQVVQEELPGELRAGPEPGGETPRGSKDLETAGRVALAAATGGVSELGNFFAWAVQELSNIGRKPIIKWDEFPGPWPGRSDRITVRFDRNVAPQGHVEVVLLTDPNSHIKMIEFEPWDPHTRRFFPGPRISNHGHVQRVTMAVPITQVAAYGVLEFGSEESSAWDIRGRYVLADLAAELTDRTRATFHWRDS